MTIIERSPDRVSGRLLSPAFLLLSVGELAYFTADGMTLYLVPVHATGPLGAGQAGAGLAFGAFALSALLLRPWAGRASDVRGRRPLLVGGSVVAVVSLALAAQVDTLAALVGLRLLAGVAEATVFVAAFATLADLAPPDRVGEALSYNSLALYVGIAVGPLLAELLVRGGGFPAGWYGASGMAALAVLTFAMLPETRPAPPPAASTRPPLVHRRSLPVALGFLTSIVAMGGFLAFAAVRAEQLDMAHTSLPLTLYGAVVVAGRLAFARVPDRVPSLPLGAASLSTIAAGLGLAAAWPSPVGLLAGTALLALGVTFSTPAFFAAIFATADATERGAAAATGSVCIDLGLGLGPVLLGLVAGGSGIPAAFVVAAVVSLAGAGWTWRLRSAAADLAPAAGRPRP